MLTEKQSAEIIMMMRCANHLQNNLPIIQDNAQLMDGLSFIKEGLSKIFAQLSDEERDGLLEQYKTEAELLGLSKKGG